MERSTITEENYEFSFVNLRAHEWLMILNS